MEVRQSFPPNFDLIFYYLERKQVNSFEREMQKVVQYLRHNPVRLLGLDVRVEGKVKGCCNPVDPGFATIEISCQIA